MKEGSLRAAGLLFFRTPDSHYPGFFMLLIYENKKIYLFWNIIQNSGFFGF